MFTALDKNQAIKAMEEEKRLDKETDYCVCRKENEASYLVCCLDKATKQGWEVLISTVDYD